MGVDAEAEVDAETLSPYGQGHSSSTLAEALRRGSIPVAVHGLGRVGLPVAAVFADVTGAVTGVDVDPDVVEAVAAGRSPVDEPGLEPLLTRLTKTGALEVTTSPAAVDARLHVVVVPTLLDDADRPDLSLLREACRGVAETLSSGDLVVVESTVPPGTCDEVVAPTLSDWAGIDRRAFGVAHCPERTATGTALQDVRSSYPRVVGGVDSESTRVVRSLYDALTETTVHAAADARTAACVKLFEGVYRDVNVALVNELARMASDLGVDVRSAIDLANTQPYCDLHDPGPGVGGHCIPYYPHFLIEDREAPLLRTARQVNDSMPAHAAALLVDLLARDGVAVGDATVLVAGLAYRPGVGGTIESPARPLSRVLTTLGATVYGLDPHVSPSDAASFALEFVGLEEFGRVGDELDGVVVVTPHDAIRDLPWDELDPTVVLDTRAGLGDALTDGRHEVVVLGDGRPGRPAARPAVDEREGGG